MTQGCAPFRVCAIMRAWTDRAESSQQEAQLREARKVAVKVECSGSNSSIDSSSPHSRTPDDARLSAAASPAFSPYAEFVRWPTVFADLPARAPWCTSLLQRICSDRRLATQLEQGKPLHFKMDDNPLQRTDEGQSKLRRALERNAVTRVVLV